MQGMYCQAVYSLLSVLATMYRSHRRQRKSSTMENTLDTIINDNSYNRALFRTLFHHIYRSVMLYNAWDIPAKGSEGRTSLPSTGFSYG